MCRLDVDRADLAAVLALMKVAAGAQVRVIEAKAGGAWNEPLPAHAMSGNVGRTLLRGTIHGGRHELAVPVELLRRVRVVVDVDDGGTSFLESQQRSRKLAVVGRYRQEALRADFHER